MAVARTFGTLALTGGRWVMAEVEPHVRIRLKQIFPRLRKTDPPPYVFPNDMTNVADLKWFIDRYPLRISSEDLKALTNGRLAFDANTAAMERILAADYAPQARAGLREGNELRVYQAQAVDILQRSKGLLVGDDVGLGKTFIACGAFLLPAALPAAAVCHAHLQKQWCDVIERFTTLRAHAIRGTKPYLLPPADVYVFRYSQLRGWSDMWGELGLRCVAFDEIQELRTGTRSDKGIAALGLAQEARYTLGLSATPIYNYGGEIFTVLGYLRPGLLGDYGEFVREWTNGTGRIADPVALGTFLREQHAMLRRSKRDVGKEMPKVNRIVDMVDHDQEQFASIEQLAHALAVKASTGDFTERGQATRELDLLVRHQTGVSKARYVADFVRILAEGGTPVVLAGWHRDVYDIWNERLGHLKPAMYTGSETAAGKEREKNRFVSGETPVLIMSLRSGAGLDGLQFRSSTIVFGELDWSPGVHHQCIGRLDREGQEEPVTAIFLVTDEGSDPPMMEVLGLKASQAAQIMDPMLGVQQTHSDIGHLQSLVKQYLQKKPRGGSGAIAPHQAKLALEDA